MATLEELKIPDIKKILRGCDIDATDILAAKTKFELIELAKFNGIFDVPDEWTIAKIKQQRAEERAKASKAANQLGGDGTTPPHGSWKMADKKPKGMSFFSRRESPSASGIMTTTIPGTPLPTREEGAPAGTFTSTASRMAQRRLDRAQGRASERGAGEPRAGGGRPPAAAAPRGGGGGGGSSQSAAGMRPPNMRTLGELKAIGLTGAQRDQILEERPPPAEGEAPAIDPGLVTLEELVKVGYTPGTLAKANFPPKMLKEAGFTPAQLLENPKCTPAVMRDLGFTPKEMQEAGMDHRQLRAAGYRPARLRSEAGMTLGDLKAAGYSAKEFKEHGFSAAEFLEAGFERSDVRLAGFPAATLYKKLKWGLEELRDAGFKASDVRGAAGCTPEVLEGLGYSEHQIRSAGFSAEELGGGGTAGAGGEVLEGADRVGFEGDGSAAGGYEDCWG